MISDLRKTIIQNCALEKRNKFFLWGVGFESMELTLAISTKLRVKRIIGLSKNLFIVGQLRLCCPQLQINYFFIGIYDLSI